MKRVIIVAFVLLLGVTMVFGQQKVGAYTTLEEPLAKELFDEFQKETGIVVNWQRLSGGEVESRLEAEKSNPQASIWVGGVGLNHISAKLKGLTTPYKSKMLENTPLAVPRSGKLLGWTVYRAAVLCYQQQGSKGARACAAHILGRSSKA